MAQSSEIVSHDSPICLIGGARISDTAFSEARRHANALFAVDSGADYLLLKKMTPHAVIGDLDSLSDAARNKFSGLLRHIPEQSTTDFEKALASVAAPLILALGFTGGRTDHGLAVLGTLARFPDAPVVLVDEDDASFVAAPGTLVLELPAEARISVMPLGAARSVTLSGVRWSFADQPMALDGFTSPSNAAVEGEVTLVTSDPVLITLPRQMLDVAVKAVALG